MGSGGTIIRIMRIKMKIINLALLSSLILNTNIPSKAHSSQSSFYLSEESEESASKDAALELDAPHHKLIGTEKAWQHSRGEGVVVAVTDSGIAYDHPDLEDNIWHNEGETGVSADGVDLCKNGIDDDANGKVDDCIGWNFGGKNNDPIPQIRKESHGSHVAGIIASSENGEGSVGVAPDAKVMIVKVLPGLWSSQKLYDSYVYAVDNGAKIINTSLEIDAFVGNKILNKALKYAEDKGAIVVNAAGNNTRGNAPKMELSNLLFVANTGVGDSWGCKEDVKTPNSNWGYGIDISAPGCRINSTVTNGKYTQLSGTSMSSPVVAGALALIWSKNPEWTREQVISRMLSTADDISKVNEAKFKAQLGAGRLNLERALSDKKQDPLSVWGLTKEIKTITDSFTIRFNGLADWNTLEENTIELIRLSDDIDPESTNYEQLLEAQVSKVPLRVNNKDKLSYGSSMITMTNENGNIKPGKYLLKVSANLKDPFSNPFNKDFDFSSLKIDRKRVFIIDGIIDSKIGRASCRERV